MKLSSSYLLPGSWQWLTRAPTSGGCDSCADVPPPEPWALSLRFPACKMLGGCVFHLKGGELFCCSFSLEGLVKTYWERLDQCLVQAPVRQQQPRGSAETQQLALQACPHDQRAPRLGDPGSGSSPKGTLPPSFRASQGPPPPDSETR